jgi:hypothetical protein
MMKLESRQYKVEDADERLVSKLLKGVEPFESERAEID